MKKILLLLLTVLLMSGCTVFFTEDSSSKSYEEEEPNDTTSQANSLKIGEEYDATMEYDGIDIFYFEYDAYADYRIDANWESGNYMDIYIDIYDYCPSYYGDSDYHYMGYDDETTYAQDEWFTWAGGSYSGRCYVVITEYGYNDTGEYTIEVTETSSGSSRSIESKTGSAGNALGGIKQ